MKSTVFEFTLIRAAFVDNDEVFRLHKKIMKKLIATQGIVIFQARSTPSDLCSE